jgi:hypothetical protein
MFRIRAGETAVPCKACGMRFAAVTCPTCFETFEVPLPHPDETPAEVDYDCEVCCRPMVIVFTGNDAFARGLAE